MPRRIPSLRVATLALQQRLERLVGRRKNHFADTLAALALSPSARHFVDYGTAPLALRFARCRWEDVVEWQNVVRAKLAEISGYTRQSAPSKVLQERNVTLSNGLTRRHIYLRARKGLDVPINLIAPKPTGARYPVMICLQGTNTGAHLSWGEVRFPNDADLKKQGYDIAIQAAQRGYLAVAIEQSCFGERAERDIQPRSEAPCVDATMHAMLLGRSLVGERCTDVSIIIDWLLANTDELNIDQTCIHIMGHSVGGSVALYAAALDQRIGAVLACGCVGFIRDTIGLRRDDQGQVVIPGILRWFEMADVVGLVAPRPFVSVAGETDEIWPAAGGRAVTDEAREIYKRYNAGDLVQLISALGGHMFRPALSWEAFENVLSAQEITPEGSHTFRGN